MNGRIYGTVNGKPTYSRDEFIFETRHFGAITSDEELLRYAEKVTWGWQNAGHKRKFEDFYLSDYALSEPFSSLTKAEFNRLCELQKIAQNEAELAENAREWKLIRTDYYADNSVEETWKDKNGELKTVMTIYPHGDAC